MNTMTIEEFHAALRAQGVDRREDLAFVCPMCQVVQSAQDLIDAGAGSDFDAVEPYLAFSCVGRFSRADAPRKAPDGKPCNWTLGGLFKTHTLEVVTPDGERHPRFALATPEQARQHATKAHA